MKEFELIETHLKPLTLGRKEALDLKDDASIIDVPDGFSLVITKDAMSEGVHFIGDEPPADIARKLLRANLSDLAAMGADPFGFFLAFMLPKDVEEGWIAGFADGIARDQLLYPIALLGGDTIATTEKRMTASITALGTVEKGKALTRKGAKLGDSIYVTGTVGDSMLGLQALKQSLTTPVSLTHQEYLVQKYRLPTPQLAVGKALRGVATACIDISDGLLQDLGHIVAFAGQGAEVYLENMPLSDAASRIISQSPISLPGLLCGGDDYELLFTAPESAHDAIESIGKRFNVRISHIGQITAGSGIKTVGLSGESLMVSNGGWQHF